MISLFEETLSRSSTAQINETSDLQYKAEAIRKFVLFAFSEGLSL